MLLSENNPAPTTYYAGVRTARAAATSSTALQLSSSYYVYAPTAYANEQTGLVRSPGRSKMYGTTC